MSQYISSYILEPVARRLSRSAGACETNDPFAPAPSSCPSQFPAAAVDELIHDDGEATVDDLQVDPGSRSGDAAAAASIAADCPSGPSTLAPRTLRHVAYQRYRTIEQARMERRYGQSEFDMPSSGVRIARSQPEPLGQYSGGSLPRRDPGIQPSSQWRSSRPSSLQQTPPDCSPPTSRQLPEDDGMGMLRRKILAVQASDRPVHEKSRLVHALMTEQYSAVRTVSLPSGPVRAQSALSVSSADRPVTPSSPCSMLETSSPATSCSFSAIPTTAEDRIATYWIPPPEPPPPDVGAGRKPMPTKERSDPVLGCAHYKRNVKLQCSMCGKWYTCRFCHDEVEDHALKRPETRNMLCMLCGLAQPAAGHCQDCEQPTAWYYCHLCKLWDNDPDKSIYHCDDCGICRVGEGLGKDFFHCHTCSACLSISIRESHRCIERSTDCDCPICGEYMFTSPQTVVFMPCGHSIHKGCYHAHMQNSYKCPLCSRSLYNMEPVFREVKQAIDNQPMPAQFADMRVWISCNDCCGRSRVPYHWLALKCILCDSYNTVQSPTSNDPTSREEGAAAPSPAMLATDGESLNALLQVAQTSGRPGGLRARSLLRAISAHTAGQSSPRLRRSSSLSSVALPALTLETHMATDSRSVRSFAAADSSNRPGEDPANSDNTSETPDLDDLEDVDFWGGESPRLRVLASGRWPDEDVDMLDSHESARRSDSEDGSDEDLSEDDDEDDDDDDNGMDSRVGLGPGNIELIGHR